MKVSLRLNVLIWFFWIVRNPLLQPRRCLDGSFYVSKGLPYSRIAVEVRSYALLPTESRVDREFIQIWFSSCLKKKVGGVAISGDRAGFQEEWCLDTLLCWCGADVRTLKEIFLLASWQRIRARNVDFRVIYRTDEWKWVEETLVLLCSSHINCYLHEIVSVTSILKALTHSHKQERDWPW